jgi:AraC-like DNA-binding protein
VAASRCSINRVQIDSNGHLLCDLDHYCARIAKTLHYLHKEFAINITVETLSEQANISVSRSLRAFHEITTQLPSQHLKKIKLTKARDLTIADDKRINDVANFVGYSSPSQFSQEFKPSLVSPPKTINTYRLR